MRVLVVSAWEPWRSSDGAALILRHQLPLWARHHDLTVLSAGAAAPTAPPPAMADELAGLDMQWFGRSRGIGGDYVSRRIRSVRSREPAHVGFVERPNLLAAIDRVLAAGIDVVHLHGWGTAQLWQRVGAVPTVHVAVDPWSVNAANRRRPLLRRVFELDQQRLVERHERRHYPHVGAVVLLSAQDAQTVATTAPGARLEVVPNGVEAGPAPVAVPDHPVLGFHGAFESQANVRAAHALVTEVLPVVRRQVPAAEVVIAGRNPPREVRALAGDGVTVHGDVADIRAMLDQITVHVDWLTSGAGVKNKVLEAMAAGRPVVASALGVAGIGAGEGLAEAGDVAAAAAIATEWLRDPAAAARAGVEGRRRVVADFGWPANGARIEALWADVSGRP